MCRSLEVPAAQINTLNVEVLFLTATQRYDSEFKLYLLRVILSSSKR